MKIIKSTDIVNEYLVCPYCQHAVGLDSPGCCGESNAHFEYGYELETGEFYLASEVKIDYANNDEDGEIISL